MKFGVHTGLQETSFDELIPLWKRIEALGYDWISVWDHIYPTLGASAGPNLDAIVALSALASSTERVRIGCLVFNTTLRPPALLANAGAAIDQLSGGRLEMGLGAGWNREEQEESGIEFPPDGVRVTMMAESIEVIRCLWSEETVDFTGRHFELRDAKCDPKPVQSEVPLWVGAFRPRALEIAGRLGDGFNAPYVAPRLWASLWRRVGEAAEAAGRDAPTPSVNVGLFPDTDLRRAQARCEESMGTAAAMGGHLCGPADAILEKVAEYRDAGVERLNVVMRPPFDIGAIESFASEIVAQFGEGDR
ncbi:MAG: LLM class flavin-dependent oxidoreductase [Acidobacteria bacterium]|nr:MAG: LLM class flavin-dependent oxidoreductase [Acidobacteriota bacterium]